MCSVRFDSIKERECIYEEKIPFQFSSFVSPPEFDT